MRVLVLTGDYAPGAWSGIGAAVSGQAAAIARQGVDVEVMLPELHAVPAVSPGARLRVRALSTTRFPWRPDAFDVVHLHSLGFSELAVQLRTRFGVPLVYTAHASLRAELPHWGRWSGWGDVQDRVIARSDHVVFTSAAERAAAVARSHALERRSSVHPNGVASAARTFARAEAGPIVFAGRFAESKGLALLSEIVDLLQGHPDVRFVIAGGHGDPAGRRAIAALAGRHPHRCRVVGWLAPAALERLFAAASTVLVPSLYEPFGMVALEAMRLGAPVLAAATGGLCEVVGPGSGGLLVHSRRPQDWCEAILRLRNSPELRAILTRRGPAYVAERYDPDTLARSLVESVYRSLGARRLGRVAAGAA